jgi:hypothetical protein
MGGFGSGPKPDATRDAAMAELRRQGLSPSEIGRSNQGPSR